MKRNGNIDVVKGIGILLVVMGHTPMGILHLVDLFHVPIFFIAAGYCYKNSNADSIKTIKHYLGRRIKSLYIPYVAVNLILLALHNLFVKCHLYTENPQLLDLVPGSALIGAYTVNDFIRQAILIVGFVGGEPFAGAAWFMRILFEVSILYVLIDFVSKRWQRRRLLINVVVSVIFLCAGYWFSRKGITIVGGLHIACSCLIFFTMGVMLRAYNRWESRLSIVSLILSVGLLLLHSMRGSTISIATNMYTSPIWLVWNGLLGWGFTWSVANVIKKFSGYHIIEYVGKKSLYILLFHPLGFKVVTLGFVMIKKLPIYALGVFPSLPYGGVWYILGGMLLPLGIEKIFQMLKQHLIKLGRETD